MKHIEFALISGSDILIKELNLVLRQPRLKELSLIGEDVISEFLGMISIDKEDFFDEETPEEVKETMTELFIFISFLQRSESKIEIILLLGMILDKYTFDTEITEKEQHIILKKDEAEVLIGPDEFLILRDYVRTMFIKGQTSKKEYNPQSAKAQAIADKIAKGREKAQSRKPDLFEDRSMMAVQISVVAVALGLSVNDIVSEYTMYQLQETYQRIAKKEAYESALKAMAAGAEDVEVEDWRTPL